MKLVLSLILVFVCGALASAQLAVAISLPTIIAPQTTMNDSTDANKRPSISELKDLLALPISDLRSQDIAMENLLCAKGLPGAEDINVQECLTTLDSWARQVKSATDENLYRFNLSPEEYENSEAYFRMLVLVTVLQRDLGIHYNEKRISAPQEGSAGAEEFFSDSRDLFLHGLMTEGRSGTCASMPVLYVSIGRRLGYPLKLVAAKSHLFVRWESVNGKERLNIEASGRGLVTHLDDFYKNWPFPITSDEIENGQYLKSLTPAEELAEFMVLRACCLMSNNRTNEAMEAFMQASCLAPNCTRYEEALASK